MDRRLSVAIPHFVQHRMVKINKSCITNEIKKSILHTTSVYESLIINTHVTVKKRQGLEAALGDGGDLTIAKDRLDHDVGQSSALEVLHDDPQLMFLVHEKTVDEVDEVAVSEVAHDLDLGDDELLLRLSLKVHLLDRDHITGRHALRHENRARRPAAIPTGITQSITGPKITSGSALWSMQAKSEVHRAVKSRCHIFALFL